MILEIKNLSFSYRENEVLKDLSMTVTDGEMVSLLGRNGAGKTTLLRLVPGFLKADGDSILLDGKPVLGMSLKERASYMAYIPQITRSVFPYSVRTSILMGCSNRLSLLQRPGPADERRVDQVIDLLNLRGIAGRNMETISGGERQLVLIARALMQDARLLILDEPTSFLDYGNQLLVLERVEDLVNQGYSCIYSTHNPDLALSHSSRTVVMKNGVIVFDDKPSALLGSDILSNVYERKIEIVRTENGGMVCLPC
ncbi:MAG: ABC transporter ATP-binding protein [Spirochaetales bacterium]|nr:ABC transporter ATP-binding protein [Spirochaetales bacterium]